MLIVSEVFCLLQRFHALQGIFFKFKYSSN